MTGALTPIGKFAMYTIKVLLPVFLGSLIFSGIVAKYNNEMNLNKSILESAYQPMKEEFRKCLKDHVRFRSSLELYKASVLGLKGGLEGFITLSAPPSEPTMSGIRRSANIASGPQIELGPLWLNFRISHEALESLFDDLAIMLRDFPEQSDLNALLAAQVKRRQNFIRDGDAMFRQINSLELGALFDTAQNAAPQQIKQNASQWVQNLERTSRLLHSLGQLESAAFHDLRGDYTNINEMTIKELNRRYGRDILDYFTDLF